MQKLLLGAAIVFGALSPLVIGSIAADQTTPSRTAQSVVRLTSISTRAPLGMESRKTEKLQNVSSMTCGVYPNQFTCSEPTGQCCYRPSKGYYCAKDLQSC